MTRISKRITTWLLGALAFVALSFGIVFTMPQTKVAKADTAVTFSAACLGDASQEPYGTSIRFDTTGATFAPETFYNWVSAADYVSIADYTTVNGRTVTEINNANPGKQPITLMMQNTGSFSFLRLYIPAEIMAISDVKSMGILDGWSFTDSKNGGTAYTSSAVTFLRTGDTMVLASNYTATTIVTPTVSTAVSGYRIGESLGGDSWVVSIDLGTGTVCGEYDLMYDGYKNLRNAIYINGKSIDEWNTQAIAENPALGETSTYLVFPQNSTTEGHAKWFAKPVGLWGNGTDDVVKLTIFKALVADAEEIVVTVGAGAYVSGQFMVAETVSNTVHTQTTQDVTANIACMTNTIKEDEGYALYFIYTGNTTSFWTKDAMVGGCLGEGDITGGEGGQSLLKYIYFNGTSLYDINKATNEAYDSTHGNIVNGGVYAPIFATLSYEVGGAIKLCVPLHFAGLDESGAGINDATSALVDNHREISLKKGLSIYDPTTGISSYITNDIVFTNTTEGAAGNTRWTKELKGNEIATEVTGIVTKANRTDGGNNENFVIFQLSNNDYDGANTIAVKDFSSLYGYIDIGGNVVSATPTEPYFNVWNIQNSLAFRAPGLDAAALQEVEYITIKAGAKFPSYNTQINGGALTYYVTSEDITFIHDVPNDTWTVGTLDTTEYTVTYTVDGTTYETQTVVSGNTVTAPDAPTKAEDDTYTYTFDCWTLDGAEYDFSKPVTRNITLVAQFTATRKPSTVDITNELSFHYQGQSAGKETYMLKVSSAYWTKAPQGGCLNEYDATGAGGGQEQMKYLYFNGTSLYDINKNDNGSYGSTQSNIASGGIYAPILVMMGKDTSVDIPYSYIQLHVPTGYPDTEKTANQNHESIEIKAGFTVTEDNVTYTVTEDIKWVNLNGSWVRENETFAADTVTIGNPRIDGVLKELYKVDITSASWNITCNAYDFMYGNDYATYRKFIFINGVSVYDINVNTDDSNYTYSTFPMTGADDATFAHPVLVESRYQFDSDPNTITLWIHKDYIASLGDDITITLGAGYSAFTTNGYALAENVDYSMIANVTVDDGTNTTLKKVVKGNTLSLSAPTKDMTENTIYTFENWYIAGTDTVYDFSTVVTEDMALEARYTESAVVLEETEITDIYYSVGGTDNGDRWLIFYLENHDYPTEVGTYSIANAENTPITDTIVYKTGLLDHIILKGDISVGGTARTEATLSEIFLANNYGDNIYINIWNEKAEHNYKYTGTIAFRTPGVSTITSVVIEEGAFFPSYNYVTGATTDDIRYAVMRTATFNTTDEDGLDGALIKDSGYEYDIQMATGAAVRIGTDNAGAESGIRFETRILKSDAEKLAQFNSDGDKYFASFGTLIVPKDYLMGGMFTHDWLDSNGFEYLDIESSAYADDEGYFFAKEDGDYYCYFGSIVALKEKNYGRDFVAVGYVKLEDLTDGSIIYVYADYDPTNSRSASFIANAAIGDRSETSTNDYKNYISENNNYSPYTESQIEFLKTYLVWTADSAVNSEILSDLANKDGTATVTPTTTKLAGAYVELLYNTNVNVKGVFTYTDGSKTAKEDFYLQAGTTSHKQYLDIFRENGVGYGMDTTNLSMTSITFTNAELEQTTTGEFKVLGLYSQDKEIETTNQEVYVTVKQDDGSEMTVGAHLGLGGSLTYLAKSGIYEGVVGQSENSSFNQSWLGYTKYKYNTGSVVLSKDTSVFDENHATGTKTTELAYYGSATSSKAADGAVNLINNFDAGRQIQQSWYAQVGGNKDATNGENGYTRADCTTGATADDPSQYWPYNPVQAGDVVSNPAQIIDYEVVEGKYIYIKARAMDWAKGRGSDNLEGTIEGGSTTKSYMENYYRLNSDGTLVVNNSFVDWNGFTDMESCAWASTELPAVYPIQSLNYYVSNIDGDGTWADSVEYNSELSGWVTNGYHQFENPAQGDTMVEDWFAWANDSNGSIALGMYIPNVAQYTSGRSTTTTALSSEYNRNALSNNVLLSKGLMSNMQSIDLTYKSAYVSNTSYTAPGINFRMEAYVPIEYTYVLCVDSVTNIRSTFKAIKDKGTVTNAGVDGYYQKVGLDAWARADKKWTW